MIHSMYMIREWIIDEFDEEDAPILQEMGWRLVSTSSPVTYRTCDPDLAEKTAELFDYAGMLTTWLSEDNNDS